MSMKDVSCCSKETNSDHQDCSSQLTFGSCQSCVDLLSKDGATTGCNLSPGPGDKTSSGLLPWSIRRRPSRETRFLRSYILRRTNVHQQYRVCKRKRSRRSRLNAFASKGDEDGIQQISVRFLSPRDEEAESADSAAAAAAEPGIPDASTDLTAGDAKESRVSTETDVKFNDGSSHDVGPAELPFLDKPFIASKMKIVTEIDVLLCKVDPERKLLQKLLRSKYLYRWERHHLVLEESAIATRSPGSHLQAGIRYSIIEEVSPMLALGVGQRNMLRITTRDGSIFLLKTSSQHLRDQWLQSVCCRRNMYKYRQILRGATRPEVKRREVQHMVEYAMASPVQDTEMVCSVINTMAPWLPPSIEDEVLISLAPLLESTQPSKALCHYFSEYCHRNPRSSLIPQLLHVVVEWILKRNADFGKHPYMRRLVQDFFGSLFCQNGGKEAIDCFVARLHGSTSLCPHPRVMPNLVAVCLASMHSALSRNNGASDGGNLSFSAGLKPLWDKRGYSLRILKKIAEFPDWRLGLAAILQPVPFVESALSSCKFLKDFAEVILRLGADQRCDVHKLLLSVRDDKDGWFDIYCPDHHNWDDELTELWVKMLETLFGCCHRRKKFVQKLVSVLDSIQRLSLRNIPVAQEVLCFMLEFKLIDSLDCRKQVAWTLQSTPSGKDAYAALLERQAQLEELHKKDGLQKLLVPAKYTDKDFAELLDDQNCSSLEYLSLAFTNVTSACADLLIKCGSLKHLNLWATRFDDAGLELISEHLDGLEVLNLCETPVTDKGLVLLSSIKSLKSLNLNSTAMSQSTFDHLTASLPALEEVDIRYTDAWR